MSFFLFLNISNFINTFPKLHKRSTSEGEDTKASSKASMANSCCLKREQEQEQEQNNESNNNIVIIIAITTSQQQKQQQQQQQQKTLQQQHSFLAFPLSLLYKNVHKLLLCWQHLVFLSCGQFQEHPYHQILHHFQSNPSNKNKNNNNSIIIIKQQQQQQQQQQQTSDSISFKYNLVWGSTTSPVIFVTLFNNNINNDIEFFWFDFLLLFFDFVLMFSVTSFSSHKNERIEEGLSTQNSSVR